MDPTSLTGPYLNFREGGRVGGGCGVREGGGGGVGDGDDRPGRTWNLSGPFKISVTVVGLVCGLVRSVDREGV